jgi:hypothetical protein
MTQCCGFGSARIRNFLSDSEPEIEVADPDQEIEVQIRIRNFQYRVMLNLGKKYLLPVYVLRENVRVGSGTFRTCYPGPDPELIKSRIRIGNALKIRIRIENKWFRESTTLI